MSYFFALILICILVWMFFGERIKAWARRRMMEKVEDAFRARMGMPSAKEERKQRRRAEKDAAKGGASRKSGWSHPGPKGTESGNGRSGEQAAPAHDAPLIPKEYAEDVEFVEYKEFTTTTTTVETETIGDGGRKKTTTTVTESQVTDVEFVEIKTEK